MCKSEEEGAPLFHKVIQAVGGALGCQALSEIAVLLSPCLPDFALKDVCISAGGSRTSIQRTAGKAVGQSHDTFELISKDCIRFLPEFDQQRFVCKKIDVLDVVVCLVLPLRFFLWLAWVYAFQDTQAPADRNQAMTPGAQCQNTTRKVELAGVYLNSESFNCSFFNA